jgi:subtilisin family serine protease
MPPRPGSFLATVVAALLAAIVLVAPAGGAPQPHDPLASQQWGLAAVRAPQAWLSNRGDGVLVGVVDSGVDFAHPDLSGRIVPGATFLDCGATSCGNGDWRSGATARRGTDSPHGTAVAGIITAAADNGAGMAGVAPASQVLTVKALDETGGSTVDVARGIDYAVSRGARVLNLSLGLAPEEGVGGTTGSLDPILQAIERAHRAGVVVVAAAGNESLPLCSFPAVIDGVVCVAAVDRREAHSFFSNFGTKDDLIALSAPGGSGVPFCGEDILVPVPVGSTGEVCDYGPGYTEAAGTSFAAPHVAGVAAILVSQGRTRAEVLQALTDTARSPGGTERGRYDPVFGFGIVDAAAAAASARRSGPATGVAEPRSTADACPAGTVPPSGFGDISGSVHRASVECVAWYGITRGRAPGAYAPNAGVTRAEMASFIARLVTASGAALPVPDEDRFTDDNGSVHEDNINRLAEAGIVGGTSPGRYEPARTVTRAEMATFLVRAYEFRTEASLVASADYFDDDNGNTHEQNINLAAQAGFTGGRGPRSYETVGFVPRDQMASFIARALDLLVENGYSVTP